MSGRVCLYQYLYLHADIPPVDGELSAGLSSGACSGWGSFWDGGHIDVLELHPCLLIALLKLKANEKGSWA
jgi:hypothetical protein